MKKEVKFKFGKQYYLLGKDKENEKIWLCEAKFDCGWYWGLGYVQSFNQCGTDIEMHTHFDSLFLNGEKCCINLFEEYFSETTITRDEAWKLLELMQTAYTLRRYSDLLHTGGANITSNICRDVITNEDEYKRINDVLIPKIMNEVYKLLGG